MRIRAICTFAMALLVASSLQAADLTVDELLAKNAEAKGGIEKLRAMKSIRLSGRMAMGPGMEAPFVMTKKREGKVRLEFTVQGMTGIQAYDGSAGWTLMPFTGRKDPEAMTGEMLKQMREEADFDGPLIDYKTKGHKVELLGRDDAGGTAAYKVKLTTREGAESLIYFDAQSFLEMRLEAKRETQGEEIDAEQTFSNYQKVDGMTFPFQVELKAKGAPGAQTIIIEKVEINPALPDESFAMPAVKPAADVEKQ